MIRGLANTGTLLFYIPPIEFNFESLFTDFYIVWDIIFMIFISKLYVNNFTLKLKLAPFIFLKIFIKLHLKMFF